MAGGPRQRCDRPQVRPRSVCRICCGPFTGKHMTNHTPDCPIHTAGTCRCRPVKDANVNMDGYETPAAGPTDAQLLDRLERACANGRGVSLSWCPREKSTW